MKREDCVWKIVTDIKNLKWALHAFASVFILDFCWYLFCYEFFLELNIIAPLILRESFILRQHFYWSSIRITFFSLINRDFFHHSLLRNLKYSDNLEWGTLILNRIDLESVSCLYITRSPWMLHTFHSYLVSVLILLHEIIIPIVHTCPALNTENSIFRCILIKIFFSKVLEQSLFNKLKRRKKCLYIYFL